MTKKFNRRTITVTTDSLYEYDPIIGSTYFLPIKTELKHDALDVLLNSPNPHRIEYPNLDFTAIYKLQHKQEELVREMMALLKSSK